MTKSAGERMMERRRKKILSRRHGDYVGVIRPMNREAIEFLESGLRQIEQAQADGDAEKATRLFDSLLEGVPNEAQFSFVGMETKDGRIADPRSMTVIDKPHRLDLTYPMHSVMRMIGLNETAPPVDTDQATKL